MLQLISPRVAEFRFDPPEFVGGRLKAPPFRTTYMYTSENEDKPEWGNTCGVTTKNRLLIEITNMSDVTLKLGLWNATAPVTIIKPGETLTTIPISTLADGWFIWWIDNLNSAATSANGVISMKVSPPPSFLEALHTWWGGYRGAEPDRNEHPERGGHLHEAGQKLLHRESNTQQAAVVLGSAGNRNPSRARNLRNPDVGFPGTAAEIPDAEIRERGIFHTFDEGRHLRNGLPLLQLRRGIDSHNPTVTPQGVA